VDTQRDDLEGELSSVTDEEWRAAHERVFGEMVATTGGMVGALDYLSEQFAYDWAPGRPGEVYVAPRERDIAPRVWEPGDPDERFAGGGFRG